MYTKYHNRLITDQGSVLTSYRWRPLSNFHDIQVRLSGVKGHNCLGLGERLHSPLRIIYNTITHAHPTRPKRFVLNFVVPAMSSTIEGNGLYPSRLMFRIIRIFPVLNANIKNQGDGMAILKEP